jgi:hypothetical protein
MLGRIARTLGTALLILLIALALGEGVLQVASLFARDRAGEARPATAHRIVSIGDSHTYGAGIPADQSYPAYLQGFLDVEAPGQYSVINLGVPGTNTTQVLHRLPVYVSLYQPDVVIVWCGINNAWNISEDGTMSGWRARLDGVASRFRLYRMVRVWLHDRQLERSVETSGVLEKPTLKVNSPVEVTLDRGGRIERFSSTTREFSIDDEMEARAVRDYTAMAEYARAAGVRLILTTYPLEVGVFVAANRAMRRVAESTGVPIMESARSLERVPKEEQIFIWAAHPTGPIYREIARDLVPVILNSREDRS